MSTGFLPERAFLHDQKLRDMCKVLAEHGYQPSLQDVSGHDPDLMIVDRDGAPAYIDLKTGRPNITIELDSFAAYMRLELAGSRVYIVHTETETLATVSTIASLLSRGLLDGPRRPNGNGSNDDWYCFKAGGTPFAEFFPPIAKEKAA